MTTDPSDEEVFLVPVADDLILAVSVNGDSGVSHVDGVDLATLIDTVGPLVGAVLKGRGVRGATYYEMSPESRKMLEGARLDKVGNYFRGVLRNPNGQSKHQVQLREVQVAPAPSGFDALAAVQMAAIQAQLGRIEDTLSDLTMSVEDVMGFLERQQRSRVEESLQILREVHDRARVTGDISPTDWDRLMSAGVESELGTQLRAVGTELAKRLRGGTFGKSPGADAKQMKAINPERTAELAQVHRMLIGGLRGWNELLILRKFSADELTEGEVATAKERLDKLEAQHGELLELLESVIGASKKTKARSGLQRLFTDGLVIGSSNDDRHLNDVKAGRKVLKSVLESAAPALPQAQARTMVANPAAAEVA